MSKLPRLPQLPQPPSPPVEEVEELLVPEEQVKIRVINFRQTVVQSTAVLLSQPSPVEGKILEATFHFPPGCFRPDTRIVMADNTEKPIQKVKVGDAVLCHACHGEVTQVFEREYEGEMLVIKPRGLQGLHVTPEHPFLAVKRAKREFPDVEPEWIRAGDLREGYWLVSPVPLESRDVDEIDLTEFIEFKGYDSEGKVYGEYAKQHLLHGITKKRIQNLQEGTVRYKYSKNVVPKSIKLTDRFLRLVGYYLAEGNPKYDCKRYGGEYHPPKHPVGLNLTFGGKERILVEDAVKSIEETFGLVPQVRERKNKHTIDIEVASVPMALLMKKLCGEHYDGKKMHPLLMSLPPEKQEQIIIGLHLGDSADRQEGDVHGIRVKNPVLLSQVWTILNRLRKKPAHYKSDVVEWRDRVEKNNRFYFEDWLVTPVVSIRRYRYKGKVHNFGVAKYNSYVAGKIAVHNCVALVDVAFGVLRGSRWESIVPDKALETGTFLALDNTLKSYPVNEPIEAGQRIWVYIRNRDGFWPHTPTITATLQGVVKVPDREY